MVKNSCFGRIKEERGNPGFFKILRRNNLSSETMRGIPYDFIKTITNKKISGKIVLRVPWGNSWQINLLRNPKFYYMEKNGWEQFLSDNALGNYEFLTFTHKGNMCFNVNIYQRDGKERLKPLKSATLASSSSSCRDKREQGKNKEEAESSSKSSSPGLKTAESTERVQKLSLRKMKAKETEVDVSCLVPEFIISIKKAYLVYLGVPRKFAEKHMPKKTTIFKIHHTNRCKSWEVTFVISDVQSRFSAGWIPLVKDLGLMIGDVCTFKLVKPTKMLIEVTKQKTPT